MFTLKENITGQEAIYKTLFSVNKQENKLIFEFYSSHCSFNSYSTINNDKIYQGDVVEIFITGKTPNHYYEIEVAPNGTIFLEDILNPGENPSGFGFLNPNKIHAKTLKINNDLATSIILDLNEFPDVSEDSMFNAFRIDTDNEKSDKHLFALSPTMCGSFHRPKAFVKLSDFLNK